MKKQFLAGLVTVVLVFSMVGSAYAIPYIGADIELLADDYKIISNISDGYVSGDSATWFKGDAGAIWTAWSRGWVEYEVNLDAGNWNIGLNVINHGNLGDNWYSTFQVSNGSGTIFIDASDDVVNNGFFNMDFTTTGLYTVRYTWLNDKWGGSNDTLHRDANIQINNVFFDNTATAPVPEPATMLLFGTGLIGLAGIARRKKLKK